MSSSRDRLLPDELRWDLPDGALRGSSRREFAIDRVLAHGTLEQIRGLRERLGDSALRERIVATRGRALDARRLRFFQAVLEMDADAVDEWLSDPRRGSWDRR
ncbi:MAG: hypothetical protein R6V85_04245 [Polyangia bacterium]